MIKLAHILPTSYLNRIEEPFEDLSMILAHQVLQDDQYRFYYTTAGGARNYRILDNSAFELDEALQDERLIEAIGIIKPDEFVLPDILFDASKTIHRLESFVKTNHDLGVRYMAVPHGRSLDEYVDCYRALSLKSEVYSLGVGAIYAREFSSKNVFGRELILRTLEDRGLISSKPHHLLGLGDSGHYELRVMKSFEQVRSCDSSAAYVNAKQGNIIENRHTYTKVPTKINFGDSFSESVMSLFQLNRRVFSEAAR